MFEDKQKSLLRKFYESDEWKLIEQIANELISEISLDSSIGESVDETVKKTYEKEGKIQGIRDLLQRIFNKTQ